MPAFVGPLPIPNLFNQGPPSPGIPGVNASVDVNAGQPQSALGQAGQTIGDVAGGIASEGIAGLLDPVGMMDRQRAARELQSKFDVVPDDFTGERLPNQLSAAEYQNVVQTYSDIRLGRSDIKIDTSGANDPAQYQADMMDDIGDIMQTASGRQLVGTLSNNVRKDASGNDVHRTTTLAPRYRVDPITGANIPDNTNAGESGDSSPGVGAPFPGLGGPGLGGDTSIGINPNMDVVAPLPAGGTATFRSDVTLFHEMVHSLHDTQGTTDTSTVSSLDGVQRELQRGNPIGALQQLTNPDPSIVADANNGVARYEHQAVGLGAYADDAVTENAYRRERNAVARSGKGMAGDLLMPQRDIYVPGAGDPEITYNNFFGM